MARVSLKYGNGHMEGNVPEERLLQVVEGREYPALEDVSGALRDALKQPVEGPPLASFVRRGDKVAVVVSDVTRAWIQYPKWLPALLDELNEAGVSDEDIALVVALGAHRKHTEAELEALLTTGVLQRVQVVEHDCRDEDQLVHVGDTSYGTKVLLNKRVVDADKVILTGGVVYHFMVGYGGGRKSILPGVAGYETIQQNHLLLMHPPGSQECLNLGDCGSGKTKGNPPYEDQMESAAMLKTPFLANVVLNPHGEIAGIFAGHYIAAWEKACRLVDDIYGVPIQEKADIVLVTCGGFPKDINLYQAVKTIDNASQAVKPGGVVVLLAECRDITEPPDFARWFRLPGLEAMERELRKEFTVPGYMAVFAVEKALQATYIVVTLPENAELIRKVGMIPVDTLEEGMKLAYDRVGSEGKVIVMPQGANTFPILRK